MCETENLSTPGGTKEHLKWKYTEYDVIGCLFLLSSKRMLKKIEKSKQWYSSIYTQKNHSKTQKNGTKKLQKKVKYLSCTQSNKMMTLTNYEFM